MNSASERIVIVSPYGPGSRDAGERRRLGAITDCLAGSHDVTLLHWEANASAERSTSFKIVTPDDQSLTSHGIRTWEYAAASALNQPAQWYNVRRRTRLRKWVSQEMDRIAPDRVLGIQLSGTAAVPVELLERCVVDSHNAEGLRWRRIAESSGAPMQRVLASRQATSSLKLERWLSTRVAGVLAVSPGDQAYFRKLGATSLLVPNGYDPPGIVHSEKRRRSGTARLLFVGSLGYSANRDALRWLAAMLPTLPPSVELSVVGSGPKDTADRLFRSTTNAIVLGRVTNISVSYASSDALIVPMRMGGGSRLKILEAMAHQLPVISTLVGAEGLGLVPDAHFIEIDQSPESWRRAISLLTHDPVGLSAMAERAYAHVVSMTWAAAGRELLRVLGTLR